MSIELKLDEKAVASLFPEGSEARVRLQSAVVDQVVKRLVVKEVAEIQRVVLNNYEAHFQQELAKAGLTKTSGIWNPQFTLNEGQKHAIQSQAQSAIQKAVKDGLNVTPEAIDRVRKDVLELMDRQLTSAVNEGLDQRINAMVRAALQNALKI